MIDLTSDDDDIPVRQSKPQFNIFYESDIKECQDETVTNDQDATMSSEQDESMHESSEEDATCQDDSTYQGERPIKNVNDIVLNYTKRQLHCMHHRVYKSIDMQYVGMQEHIVSFFKEKKLSVNEDSSQNDEDPLQNDKDPKATGSSENESTSKSESQNEKDLKSNPSLSATKDLLFYTYTKCTKCRDEMCKVLENHPVLLERYNQFNTYMNKLSKKKSKSKDKKKEEYDRVLKIQIIPNVECLKKFKQFEGILKTFHNTYVELRKKYLVTSDPLKAYRLFTHDEYVKGKERGKSIYQQKMDKSKDVEKSANQLEKERKQQEKYKQLQEDIKKSKEFFDKLFSNDPTLNQDAKKKYKSNMEKYLNPMTLKKYKDMYEACEDSDGQFGVQSRMKQLVEKLMKMRYQKPYLFEKYNIPARVLLLYMSRLLQSMKNNQSKILQKNAKKMNYIKRKTLTFSMVHDHLLYTTHNNGVSIKMFGNSLNLESRIKKSYIKSFMHVFKPGVNVPMRKVFQIQRINMKYYLLIPYKRDSKCFQRDKCSGKKQNQETKEEMILRIRTKIQELENKQGTSGSKDNNKGKGIKKKRDGVNSQLNKLHKELGELTLNKDVKRKKIKSTKDITKGKRKHRSLYRFRGANGEYPEYTPNDNKHWDKVKKYFMDLDTKIELKKKKRAEKKKTRKHALTVNLDDNQQSNQSQSSSSSDATGQVSNDGQVKRVTPENSSFGVDYVFHHLIDDSIQSSNSSRIEFSSLIFECKYLGNCSNQGEVKQEFISGYPGLRKVYTFFFSKKGHLFNMSIKLSQRSKLKEMTSLIDSMTSVLKKGKFLRSKSPSPSGSVKVDCTNQMRRKIKVKQEYLRSKKKNIMMNLKHIISKVTSFFDITILPNTTSSNFRKGIKNIYKEFRDVGFASLLQTIQYKANLFKVEESYTSKLCLNCLNTNEIGAAESYTCEKCPKEKRVKVDRDESASRAIYYRTVHRFSL